MVDTRFDRYLGALVVTCLWLSSAAQQTTAAMNSGSTSASSSSSLSAGAIVGIVIGVLAFFILLTMLFFWQQQERRILMETGAPPMAFAGGPGTYKVDLDVDGSRELSSSIVEAKHISPEAFGGVLLDEYEQLSVLFQSSHL
ncbi:hypothetical protein BZG36_05458 [Bifiguratus adelaidae]|uniref:Uncharacterized protein n=1 Tax=Bifiguratus adelaidae TaxID=1938954 RepID=A0A261XT85_9FUNG|nr:hypothetical protein BZG36_05458 [Bifiguratus adelaidae]